jgi:hypothetical protein
MKTEPLWSAGALGAVVAVWDLARRRRLDPLPGLAVIWGGAAFIALVANGVWLFNSYFIHALPDEFASAGFEQLRGRSDRLAYLERFGGYANSRGYSARANAELTEYLRARLEPGDRLYFFGINFSAIYFTTDALMANRFLRTNVFVPSVFPQPGFSLDDVVGELEAKRPRYLVFETLHSPSAMGVAVDALPHDPRVRPLLASYRLETRIEDFAVYRRVE